MAVPTITPLAPAEAVAALTARGVRLDPSFSWQDAWQAEHANMFTVAKSAGFDILKDIHDGLMQALAEGTTFEQFARDLRPTLEAKGWWGRKEVTDPATGEIRPAQLGSTRRLRTIFDTNMRVSYASGHWAQFERNRKARPVLRYVAILDGRVRPAHRARHNLTLPIDDPYWDTWAPPCGWGCRCTLQSLSLRDVERMRGELKFTPPPETFRTFTNKRTGEVVKVPDGIDPGWGYNPGKAAFRAVAIPTREADIVRDLVVDQKATGGSGGRAVVVPLPQKTEVQPPPKPDPAPPKPVYPAIDRSQTRPVNPDGPGGLEDGDYVFSYLKKYPEGITVGDFVRTHPQGEKAARRVLKADYQAGRVAFERRIEAANAGPLDPGDDTRTKRAQDWHRLSFRTDDPDLTRAIAAAPEVQRIAPIPSRGAFARGAEIHMDGFESRADTALAQATWRHEFGHHLDVAAGKGTSTRWASSSPAATRAMRADFDAMRAKLSDTRQDAIAGVLRGRSDGQIDAALKQAGVDLTCADLRTIVRPACVPDAAAALIAKDARAYLIATKDKSASDVSEAALGFTSDGIEAISQATIGGQAEKLVGHGADYYRRRAATSDGYTEAHGAEAFANYISLRGSAETAAHYRAFRHFAPSTAETFDAIVRAFA